MILNGIIGILGGKKKSACLLLLFNLVNIGLLLGFIALMILGYVLANRIEKNDIKDYCSSTTPL